MRRASISRSAASAARPAAPPEPILEFIRAMWALDHELQRVSKRMVSRMGLTAPQRLAVRFIGREHGVTPSALAELLHVHPGTVTGIVRRLEGAGLVTRVRSTADTRRLHLSLTSKGRLLDRQRRGTVEAAVRRTAATLTADQFAITQSVITLLAEHLAEE
jgi:MarR family transcriptional regulator, organic hydroperoxide resistance regulator